MLAGRSSCVTSPGGVKNEERARGSEKRGRRNFCSHPQNLSTNQLPRTLTTPHPPAHPVPALPRSARARKGACACPNGRLEPCAVAGRHAAPRPGHLHLRLAHPGTFAHAAGAAVPTPRPLSLSLSYFSSLFSLSLSSLSSLCLSLALCLSLSPRPPRPVRVAHRTQLSRGSPALSLYLSLSLFSLFSLSLFFLSRGLNVQCMHAL